MVNLIGLALGDRPAFFEKLFSDLLHLRARTGRPHWLILDEAHHILPCSRNEAVSVLPEQISGILLITLQPEHLATSILKGVDLILAIGENPSRTISTFCGALEEPAPSLEDRPLEKGEAIAWWRRPRGEPFLFRSFPPSLPKHRHIRKYAEGDVNLGAFIFTGPDGRLKLRAQNLFVFLQMGEGLDDLTWDFHLRRGDYENWFRWIIKDEQLADFVREVAQDFGRSPDQTRKAFREKIEERYTAPQ